jgi:hypothetical protein
VSASSDVELPIYGLMAEFDRPQRLLEAAQAAHAQGYRRMDAYTPFPVEGLDEALGLGRDGLPALVLAGGIAGALAGLALQYYAAVLSYPLNVGGRPYASWPAFIPATFELTILVAAGAAVLGMLALNGLPAPYHPVFSVPRFELASRHGFFLCIEAADSSFHNERTRRFLEGLGPVGVYEVESW